MSSQPSSSVAGRGDIGAARARWRERRSSVDVPRPRMPGSTDRPPLRLVGDASVKPARSTVRPMPAGQAISGPTDPRWVLAVRTAEQLEGTILTPEKRQRLIRTGRVMGLTPFDCNLVIAIVQDQARRGHAAAYCPAAGEAQLSMVPLPRRASVLSSLRQRPVFVAGVLVVSVLLIELMVLRWFF